MKCKSSLWILLPTWQRARFIHKNVKLHHFYQKLLVVLRGRGAPQFRLFSVKLCINKVTRIREKTQESSAYVSVAFCRFARNCCFFQQYVYLLLMHPGENANTIVKCQGPHSCQHQRISYETKMILIFPGTPTLLTDSHIDDSHISSQHSNKLLVYNGGYPQKWDK